MNPLAILGNLAGGLATIGASGAAGAYEGEVEGIKQASRLSHLDALTRLQALHALKAQGEMTRPTYQFHGDRMFEIPPWGTPGAPVITELPPTATSQARMDLMTERAGLAKQQADLAEQRRLHLEEQGPKPVNPIQAWQTRLGDALSAGDRAAADQATKVLNSFADIHARQGAPRQHFETKTDAQGRVTGLVYTQQPDNSWKVEQIPIGPIGMPQRPAAGLTPRETVTQTEKVTPRRPIRSLDEMNFLNAALPEVVNELSRKPGFAAPGAFVRLPPSKDFPHGALLRKEDIIAYTFLKNVGVEVSVQWDPSAKRFRIVRAWEPEQRHALETMRTTGPVRGGPEDDEEAGLGDR